jgi:hypothetical protein
MFSQFLRSCANSFSTTANCWASSAKKKVIKKAGTAATAGVAGKKVKSVNEKMEVED